MTARLSMVGPEPKSDRCARKQYYPSYQAARRTWNAHRNPPPVIYHCNVCGGWHLAGRMGTELEAKFKGRPKSDET